MKHPLGRPIYDIGLKHSEQRVHFFTSLYILYLKVDTCFSKKYYSAKNRSSQIAGAFKYWQRYKQRTVALVPQVLVMQRLAGKYLSVTPCDTLSAALLVVHLSIIRENTFLI